MFYDYNDNSQKKRGIAVVIANTNFSNARTPLETRTGTDQDIAKLRLMLNYLKFDVHEHSNLTAQVKTVEHLSSICFCN